MPIPNEPRRRTMGRSADRNPGGVTVDDEIDGGASADSALLTERHRQALRAARPLARRLLQIAGEVLASGLIRPEHEPTWARAMETVAILDEIAGDRTGPAWSREEHQATAIRVARAAGYDVTFAADGALLFASEGADLYVSGDVLDVDGPIEPALVNLLANASDGGAAFAAWLEGHRGRG